MCVGIIIASLAFFISSYVQQIVEVNNSIVKKKFQSTISDQIAPNEAFITLINNFQNNCDVKLEINSEEKNITFKEVIESQSVIFYFYKIKIKALIDDKLQNLSQIIRIPLLKKTINLNIYLMFNGYSL